MQSVRIVANPFGEYLDTSSLEAASQGLATIRDILMQLNQNGLRIRFAIGEARTPQEIALLPGLIRDHGDLSNACVNVEANADGLLDNAQILRCVEAMQEIARITPLVREALGDAGLPSTLADAGIDRVLVGTGPAPFTGLRSGLVSARVLARVASVPAYGVSALDVIARQGLDLLAPDTRVYAIADARRRELYWGAFVAAGPDDVALEGRLEVGDVSSLLGAMRQAPGLVVAGAPVPAHSASALARADLGPQVELDPAVMSRIVATRLARGEDERLRTDPLYLRRPDIHGQPTARL